MFFLFALLSSRPNEGQFFEVVATMQIKSDTSISLRELDGIVRSALDSGRIGEIRVKRDKTYSLVPIEGNFIYEMRSYRKKTFAMHKLTVWKITFNSLAK